MTLTSRAELSVHANPSAEQSAQAWHWHWPFFYFIWMQFVRE